MYSIKYYMFVNDLSIKVIIKHHPFHMVSSLSVFSFSPSQILSHTVVADKLLLLVSLKTVSLLVSEANLPDEPELRCWILEAEFLIEDLLVRLMTDEIFSL